MEAAQVINLLKEEQYGLLLSVAEAELIDQAMLNFVPTTMKLRQTAADAYLQGPGKNIYAYQNEGMLILTNGHSAFFLASGIVDVITTGTPDQDLTTYLRTPPGNEVEVIWLRLYLEMELHKFSDERRQRLYVRLGKVCVDAELLAQARTILSGEDLRVYEKGAREVVQLESENGKAIILPAIPKGEMADKIVDITAHKTD